MTQSSPVRVRFAPSPTGFLHIGGVRTALFNWLYARHFGGQFLLRIEDTDLERSEAHFTDDILASLKWLGLTWDEEPIFQSKHLDLYRQKAEELVSKGHAYYCDCTTEQVDAMREAATKAGKKPKYDGHCRDRKLKPAADKPSVIRVKIPLDGFIEFTDLIRGPIKVENEELDDYVIVRSNGAPTYNLSVVIDDGGSKMTHIIRGDDHINNTPKQIHLYQFFGYSVPLFAHLPMILGPDKKKLSKRHGAVSANLYRAEGYLPETMLNFLARLGWSHGDQEIFTVEEMVKFFSFDHVQKSSAVFNAEKLMWLSGEHIRKASPERLADIISEDCAEQFKGKAEIEKVKSGLGIKLISLIQPKVKLIKELADQLVPLCTQGPVEVDPSGLKWNKDPALKAATKAAVVQAIADFSTKAKQMLSVKREGSDELWGNAPSLGSLGMTHVEIDAYLRSLGERHGVKLGDLTQPMRLTVTGRMVSAGLFDLLEIMPWDFIEPRLKKIADL